MSQVGNPYWNRKVKRRVEEVFYNLLVAIRSREAAVEFCRLLLTPTENINLPRRLGILIMLSAGVDQRTISDKLHVSTCTINRISNKLKEEDLDLLSSYVHTILKENKSVEQRKIARPAHMGGKYNPIELERETDLPF